MGDQKRRNAETFNYQVFRKSFPFCNLWHRQSLQIHAAPTLGGQGQSTFVHPVAPRPWIRASGCAMVARGWFVERDEKRQAALVGTARTPDLASPLLPLGSNCWPLSLAALKATLGCTKCPTLRRLSWARSCMSGTSATASIARS